jgi:hypothetical protein
MLEIEIVDTNLIDGGIEVFARAWRDGSQIGFGADGTVDVERFRFFNPPILVPDEAGDIIQPASYDPILDFTTPERRLREDPEQALLISLAHTIKQVGKLGTTIKPNSIGRTTSTFYPAAGSTSPVDGRVYSSTTVSYAAAQSGSALSVSDVETNQQLRNDLITTTYGILRHFYLFDTSSIPEIIEEIRYYQNKY